MAESPTTVYLNWIKANGGQFNKIKFNEGTEVSLGFTRSCFDAFLL